MAITTADAFDEVEARTRVTFGPLAVGGVASLGAGAVHAAAIGVHGEHQAAVRTFAILALVQLAWGGVALVRSGRALATAGVLVNAGAVAGWVLAKTSGISFISGMGEKEAIQWPDLSAAVLASVAALVALRVLVGGHDAVERPGPGSLRLASAGGLTALAMVGMLATGGHAHAEGGHGHGGEAAAAGHVDGDDHVDGEDHADGQDHAEGEVHTAVAKPYDPTKPIDLGGTEGVSEEQQAAAENLIAITLVRLPQFADHRTAEAAGYHSIGDAGTGHEHFVNWGSINDEHLLDPDHPESLVYEPQPDGSKKLVAAMYMLRTGDTLDDVPELGGPLTQWHIHDNLCYSLDPEAPKVAGLTDNEGNCRPGLQQFEPVPMIHVWITKHPCGPFAALEGVGAGQIKEGEERLCDEAHGH